MSWTDRVFFRKLDGYNITLSDTPGSYKGLFNVNGSDHKPVVAQFEIEVKVIASDRRRRLGNTPMQRLLNACQ